MIGSTEASDFMHITTSVLIVGGSLNGLTTALLLAHHGVRCVVVERHADTAIQYKFAGISPRSMEIFRSVGIEEEIRTNRTGDQQAGAIARGKTLADPNIQWLGPAWEDVAGLGPSQPATCDQHRLEPILRAHAERLGADIRFNTEFVAFEQDERGVSARIRDRATGKEEAITADYLIGADGANSTIREALGIPRQGVGALQHFMNVIFDTDMTPMINGKRFTSCFVTDLNGTITTREGGRWLLAQPYRPEHGERPEDFDAQYCRKLVRKGAGRSDVKADLVDARHWEVAAYIAERFDKGRAFLLGDAAHVMPPTGAFGGNTGIHDAHNLAWKLAAVIEGAADAALLHSYDSERRPVAECTLAQALARLQAWFKEQTKPLPPPAPIVDGYDVIFGQRYHTGALVSEDRDASLSFEKARELSGRPGSRAPHVVVERRGREISTLDLFGRGFVLLTGPTGGAWFEAVARIGQRSRLRLTGHRVGPDGDLRDVESRCLRAYGLGEGGAVLVRPDGFVAWRTRTGSPEPERVLDQVLKRLHSRPRVGEDVLS